ncbi:MAG: hypothetical protein EA424_21310 [Planctomycetaceae bacterium]|nr:MAG: hypothetical protein EA424_21310 [Planctomycetaceae bacterium]
MTVRRPSFPLLIGMVWLTAVLGAGCAQFRLPAIDPTGERLFLPADRYTTLVTPSLIPGIPEPAYQDPPPVPPCATPPPPAPIVPWSGGSGCVFGHCRCTGPTCSVAAPSCGVQPSCGVHPTCDITDPTCAVTSPSCGIAAPPVAVAPPAAPPPPPPPPPPPVGRILVAPHRLMAPVGSEVILVAGLVGRRGEYEPRQRIEWTIAPDSVGHLLTTASDGQHLGQILHHASHRRSGSQAITWTSASPQVLTRGTPTPTDDISILRGQSWVTVTSPSEGTSHVTVLAPKAKDWDQRRQTATIYWVDVQWTFPAPAVVQTNQPHTLTTFVQRMSGKPQEGWTVRYELLQAGASLGSQGQTSIEVSTDEAGRASVELMPVSRSQATQIEIKIIRPSDPNDDLPRMVVGRGFTTVTWSAPDPQVTLYGPQSVQVGGVASYRADVSNAGDVVARDLTVSANIPANMSFLQSEPPAQVMGDRLVWNLGSLAPTQGRSLAIHLRPEHEGDVRFCVRAASGDSTQQPSLSAEACVQTRVIRSSLAVRLSGPETARVGEQVTMEIEITNTGLEPLTGVLIRNRLPFGLELVGQPGSVIERSLPDPLPAGESRRIELPLIARQPGRLCQTVEVSAAGEHTAVTSGCIDVTQPSAPISPEPPTTPALPPADPKPKPQASMRVTIEGPLQARVGQSVNYLMTIINEGDVPLTGVRIVNTYEPSLYPQEASKGFDPTALRRGELVWTVDRIEPGERIERESKYECLRVSTAAWSRVEVVTAEQVRGTRETTTQILPADRPREPADRPREPADAARDAAADQVTGTLRVSIADTRDPIAVNGTTTYIIGIENARDASDRNVTLTILLPPGIEYVSLKGPVAARRLSDDQRTIEVTPIAEVRANETLHPFYLEARGTRIGKHTVRVRVDSFRSAQPVEAETDTTVTVSG